MEQDGHNAPNAGVARSQNVVYVMPHNWTSIAQFLEALVQRVDETRHEIQAIIIASDSELATAASSAALRLAAASGRSVSVAAATSVRRASRLIRTQSPHIVTGTPDTLVGLIRSASLKLEAVQSVCIAWADELVARAGVEGMAAIEALMIEIPKEASRTIVTSELTPSVEELIERYARRARRVINPVSETDLPINVEYLTVSPQTRLTALRRVLDELDPESAIIVVRESANKASVAELLETLGYHGPKAPVRIAPVAPPGTDLAVLFDLPATREELREATSGASRTVALIQPRQLNSLRGLTAGGNVAPYTLSDARAAAQDRDARLRSELRGALSLQQFGREVLALEELLEEFDGIEIAAAAVQLLERERAAHKAAVQEARRAPVAQAAGREREPGTVTRLFVSAGSRDNARPGDIVGAIANTAGIPSADLGKIDVRESHSIVEVANEVADKVIERVTGTQIKGRRVIVRRDEGRPKREGGEGRPRREGGGRDMGRDRSRERSTERRAPRRPREGRE